MRYFWYYSADTTPSAVVDPRDLRPSDKINVSCTQTRLPGRSQRALVSDWCDLLPTLDGVRLLWFSTKVPQVLFEAACRMPKLEGLWIKWSAIESIESIERLAALKYFHLGSSTRLESIDPLSSHVGLRWLGLENLARIRHLDPLATLHELEGLALEGSMWTTWTVATLSPVGGLAGLRYLSIANLRSEDETLSPLFGLRNLETLIAAQWWRDAELAQLRGLNPRLAP